MDLEYIRSRLPENAASKLRSWISDELNEDLGGEFLIFCRELVMPDDFYCLLQEPEYKHQWAASCKCSACGSEFYAGWLKDGGKRKGIKVIQGEDGQIYDGVVEQNYDDYDAVPFREGDDLLCPACGEKVRLIHKTSLRNGRVYQVQVVTIENIGKYTTLISWIARQKIYDTGYKEFSVRPRSATVIGDDRKLYSFLHIRGGGCYSEQQIEQWKVASNSTLFYDSMQKVYQNYEAFNHKQFGGYVFSKLPELAGTTGEKTGLAEYIDNGGYFPYSYLDFWCRHPNVENIVKSAWGYLVTDKINDTINRNAEYGILNKPIDEIYPLNFSSAKPHEILGLTKDDFRQGSCWGWSCDDLMFYQSYIENVEYISAVEFESYIDVTNKDTVYILSGMSMDGYNNFELSQTIPYLLKQEKKNNIDAETGAEYLKDYRQAWLEVYRTEPQISEDVFPKNILEAHDRINSVIDNKANEDLKKAFQETASKYADLQWTDGELCIRVAKSNAELVKEGNVLRHCVGTYGKQHCAGKDVIFFVRKHRRPGRSYYTLDIEFSNGKPKEKQLHGYGNERHGAYKQYNHSIPQKVRDFCDRWEKEVLKPWYIAEVKKQLKSQKEKSA